MFRNINSFLVIMCVLLFLGGCAGKALVDTSRVELARAESLVRAAEMAGADELAVVELAQAKKDLELAQAYYEALPRTGTLFGNLERKEELKQQAMLNSRRALNSAELALIKTNEAKSKVATDP